MDWWNKPRRIAVVVDNPSWVLPYAEALVESSRADGEDAYLAREHAEIERGSIAFYLGCTKITPPDVLERNYRNLVVHASDLPNGRGFSPLTWQTIEGKQTIPICLFEAGKIADDGPVVYRDEMKFEGHELVDEMRAVCGDVTVGLCHRYLGEVKPPHAEKQTGAPTYYERRRPPDSRLDPERSIGEQFDLLRTVDNTHYPAFFDIRGHRYELRISKVWADAPSKDDRP